MDNLWLWDSCLIVGTIFFAIGIFMFVINRGKKEIAFVKMSLCELIAAYFLIFPDVYLHDGSSTLLMLLKCFLLTLLNVLKIFSGNGYDEIVIEGHPTLNIVYILVLGLVNLCIMIALIGFILQFLGDFIEDTVFYSNRFSKVYIFSGVNERTISIARSVQENEKNKGKKYSIIFVDESSSDDSKKTVREMGAHYTNESFCKEIGRFIRKTKEIDIFIFGDSEEDNLTKLGKFTALDLAGDIAFTRVYVELTDTPWYIYGNFVKNNRLPKDKVTVNLVNSNESFVLNDLYEHSVFDNARLSDKESIIDVLIAGISNKSIEMVKALLALGQMPGYMLKITVLDDKGKKDVFRRIIPELKERSDEFGEAVYSFECIDDIDSDTDKLEKIITEKCPEFTFAFIATDDNVQNINLGLRIRTLRSRLNKGNDYRIRICVNNSELISNWIPELRSNVELVGGIGNIYDYRFLTMSKIEQASKLIHDIRQNDMLKKDPEHDVVSWEDYSNDEFKRHSVYARTLSLKYKIEVIRNRGLDIDVIKTDKTWETYEHMRWNMYMRSLGYVLSDKTGVDYGSLKGNDRLIAQVHNCLIPFEDLPQEEKDKDSIKLTEDVVKAFGSVK